MSGTTTMPCWSSTLSARAVVGPLAPSTIRRALTRFTFLVVIWFSTAQGASPSQSISSSPSLGAICSAG